MFDCVVPTRLARNGSALTPEGECPCATPPPARIRPDRPRLPVRRMRRFLARVPAPPVPVGRDPCPPPGEPAQHHPSRPADGRGPRGDPRGTLRRVPSGPRWPAPLGAPVDWAQVFRITRFRLAVVLLVVVGAFFIDGYSLIYRYLVVHQPLGTTLTSAPTFLGRQLYIHKGLDLQGGTELTIEICHGLNNPNAELPQRPTARRTPWRRHSRRPSRSSTSASTRSASPRRASRRRVTTRSSCNCPVSACNRRSRRSARPPGSTSRPRSPGPRPTRPPQRCISDQQGHYDVAQFSDTLSYPAGYHWKIDNNIDATDVNSADRGDGFNHRGHHRRHQLQLRQARRSGRRSRPPRSTPMRRIRQFRLPLRRSPSSWTTTS